MKKYSKNREIRRRIKSWLEDPDPRICPFRKIWKVKHKCEICVDILPSIKLDVYGDAGLCPCDTLSFKYVIRKAREYIKGRN